MDVWGHWRALVVGGAYAQFVLVGCLMRSEGVDPTRAGCTGLAGLGLLLLCRRLGGSARSPLAGYVTFVLGALAVTITVGAGPLLLASGCPVLGLSVLGIGLHGASWAIQDR